MARYCITTPEQVQFHYGTAGLVTRAAAWLVDQLLLSLLRVVVIYALGRSGEGVGLAFFFLGIFALDFGYFLGFELRGGGQTPGKRLFGLRVISGSGGRLRFPDVFVRNMLRPLDTLPLGMLTGGAVALIDRWNRRLGDLAADTLVVREARREIPEGLLAQQARVNTFQADPAVRGRILARVTREERDLLLDLMMRRDELNPAKREELFAQAARRLTARYGLPEDLGHLSDEQVVLNAALVIQGAKFAG